MFTNLSCRSVFQASRLGAVLGFAGALAYGMVFVLYGILHTSLWIIARPANGLLPTLLANAVSVVIGAMFFAVWFGLFAALIQAGTLALVYALAGRLNPEGSPRAGAWIGLLAAAGVYLALLMLLRGGPQIVLQVFWRQSFLFWFGLPGALYLALNAWLGSRLRMGAAPQPEAAGRKAPVAALNR
jgi:hypothetical protein